jgi:hypothetical protein
MSNGSALGVWLFLTMVPSVAIVSVVWYVRSRDQMRHEIVLKILESGQAFDSATLDTLLSRRSATARTPVSPLSGPRDGYRNGGFVYFLIAFGTIVFAVTRSVVSYPLIALGLLPLLVAILIWRLGERDFRAGTLPTLKYQRDPREAHQSAGTVFFMIGYGTAFAGTIRGTGLSYPLIGLGLLLVIAAFRVWAIGDREYRAGLLDGGALRAPDHH